MWQKCTLGNSGADCLNLFAQGGTWQAALAAANDNADNGYDDWRLLNKNELESLVELASFDPAINGTIFLRTGTAGLAVYWSSSLVAGSGNADHAWVVSFGTGSVHPIVKDNDPSSKLVRLVRGGL
jgi:hypothetical protein